MRKTILVIDDENSICDALANFLEFDNKFEVFTATSGNEAISIIKIEKVNLILTDICMPFGDGVKVLESIKQINRHIPVLVMTGNAEIDQKKLLGLGAIDVIKKPFEISNLLWKINNCLENNDSDNTHELINYNCKLDVHLKFPDHKETMEVTSTSVNRKNMNLILKNGEQFEDKQCTFTILQGGACANDIGGVGEIVSSLNSSSKEVTLTFTSINGESNKHLLQLVNRLKISA